MKLSHVLTKLIEKGESIQKLNKSVTFKDLRQIWYERGHGDFSNLVSDLDLPRSFFYYPWSEHRFIGLYSIANIQSGLFHSFS